MKKKIKGFNMIIKIISQLFSPNEFKIENQQIFENIDDLKSICSVLNDYENLKNEFVELTYETEALEKMRPDLATEYENLERNYTDLAKENENLERIYTDLKNENERFKDRLIKSCYNIWEIGNGIFNAKKTVDINDLNVDINDYTFHLEFIEEHHRKIEDYFSQLGYEIEYANGEYYYPGKAVNVIDNKEIEEDKLDPNLEYPIIYFTVKPRIFYNGKLTVWPDVKIYSSTSSKDQVEQ